MSPGAELTIYFIAMTIICCMGLISYAVIEMHRETNKRITDIRNQLLSLILTSKTADPAGHIDADVELLHPETGESMHTVAKIKPRR